MSYRKAATALFVLFLSTFASTAALAKEKQVEGYYIPRASAKKIRTTFYFTGRHPSFHGMQKGVDFMDDRGKKRLLLPTEADEFGYIYKTDTIVMRSVYDNLGSQTDLFLQVLVDGVVSCYSHYEYRLSAPGPNGVSMGQHSVSYPVLQHSNGELVKIRDMYFRKDMADFFADCPALVEKIKQDGQRKTIAWYAKEYTRSCH